MRFVYSVARFVPDPTRGEFINLGLIAGSDDTGEWALRTVSNLRRARSMDDNKILPAVMSEVTRVGGLLDLVTEARQSPQRIDDLPPVSEAWLAQLARDSANILQFSSPTPVVAESPEEVFEQLWDLFVVEPAVKERGIRTKHYALGKVREAFRKFDITASHVQAWPVLCTSHAQSSIDFAVHNGRVRRLTQCWSFEVSDKEELLDSIRAWAWTIRELRRNDGEVRGSDNVCLPVARDVPVDVVYVPPREHDRSALDDALATFHDDEVRANDLPLDDDPERIDRFGSETAQLLGVS